VYVNSLYVTHIFVLPDCHSCSVWNTFIFNFQVIIHPYSLVDFVFLLAEMLVMYISLEFTCTLCLYTYTYVIRVLNITEWIKGYENTYSLDITSSFYSSSVAWETNAILGPSFAGFRNSICTHLVGPLRQGIGPSQGRYLHRENAEAHPWKEWQSNPRVKCSTYYLQLAIKMQ
jgi:hypothetical protein